MSRLREALPPPVRRILGRARRAVIGRLGGDVGTPPPVPPAEGIAADDVLRLLFAGGAGEARERLGVPADRRVRELREVRELLGAVERQATPSPVTVRFGPDDVVVRDFGRFRLVLDTADLSVGAPLADADRPGARGCPPTWEPHTTAVFEQHVRPGMTVVDVGANVGWFSMLAAALVGPGGRVVAVEPWSENCRLLLLSILENGFDHVELWPLAVDRARGWAHFMNHVGSNGGLIPGSREDLASGRGTVVPAFPLDDLLAPEEPVHFLKIDVEGAEHRVVLGASRTLERHRPVVLSEFSLEMSGRVCGIEPVEYLRWFTTRGWRLHVVEKDGGGEPRPFGTPEELLAWWPAFLHQEDLLFLPS